jgi:hypothetical protein
VREIWEDSHVALIFFLRMLPSIMLEEPSRVGRENHRSISN